MIDISVSDSHGAPVDLSNDTSDVFVEGNVVAIEICKQTYSYEIYRNLPSVRVLQLPNHVTAGFILQPRVLLDFCEIDQCKIEWFWIKSRPVRSNLIHICGGKIISGDTLLQVGSDTGNQATEANNEGGGEGKKHKSSWHWVHTGIEFVTKPELAGGFIAVVCTPLQNGRPGFPVVAESSNPIGKPQSSYSFTSRHPHTKEEAGSDSLRVVTYNILSEKYSDTCESRDFRYCYCPPFALTYDYRKQLVLAEIIGYKADILCLQEVDSRGFSDDFKPILGRRGYSGKLTCKNTNISQGVATFYKSEKFELISQETFNTAKRLESDPVRADLRQKLASNVLFKEKALLCGAACQILVLKCKTRAGSLIVVNTHLKSGAAFSHIRLLQIYVILSEINRIQSQHAAAALVVCGDLNSQEISGVVELLRTGSVGAENADWFIGGRNDFISHMALKSPVGKLDSAYMDLRYTNYVSGFIGTIDYIHFDSKFMNCSSTVPLPSHEEVVRLSALPNVSFPSDHLALVADLTWL